MNALHIAVLAGVLVAAGQAQQTPPESGKTVPPAAGAEAARTAEAAAPQESPRYARIVAETARLRCFASARSPFFEEELSKGQVVTVDERVGDFWRVRLPVGVTGYVHKKFTSETEDGRVVATGTNVSFRYRPRGSEVPVMLMPKGTSLLLLADAGQWWKVMHPSAPCWVADADVEVTTTETAALEAALRDTEVEREKMWRDAVAARAAAEAEARRRAALVAKLDEIDTAFRAALDAPQVEQGLQSVAASLESLLGELPAEGAERERAENLRQAIERQQLLVRARALADEPIVTRNEAAEILTETVSDPLARFDAIGWLRREESLRSGEHYYLYKGGRRLYELTCRSGRYDLRLFDGVEVGVRGSRGPGRTDGPRQLDVLKLEVLQLPVGR